MSVQTSANAETVQDQSSIPPLSAAQMSGPDPDETVNAFRGAVSFPLHLVSLTARNGLHADVSISYQSAIEWNRRTWNLAAPTGQLGLGWSFGFDMILRDEAQSALDGEDVLYIVAEGTPVRLYLRAVAGDLWEYEVEHHPFWRLSHDRAREAWALTLPDGNTKTFGGAENARQYSIRWGSWSGASTVTTGQDRVPTIWNLSRIGSPWGHGIDFNYTVFEEDEVRVGPGGQSYTRASYLASITTDVGRSLRFEYGQKRDDEEVREFVAPHQQAPWRGFGVYQDRYEARYLSRITAWSEGKSADEATRLLTIDFDYVLKNYSDEPNNAALFKRYLTGVVYRDRRQRAKPSLRFDYYGDEHGTDHDAPDARGALKSITYPEGKTVSYVYETACLPHSALERRLTEDDTGVGVPRVWVRDDYTLVVRYDEKALTLTISACSWNGAWLVETVGIESLEGPLDLDTLQVAFAEECFAVGYRQNPAAGPLEFRVQAFHRRFGEYGRWTGTTLKPVSLHDAAADATLVAGRGFIVAMASGTRAVARVVWNERFRDWEDHSCVLESADDLAAASAGNHYVLARYDRRSATCSISLVRFDTFARRWTEVALDLLRDVVWELHGSRVFLTTGPSIALATFVTRIAEDHIDYQVMRYRWDPAFRPLRPAPLNPGPVPRETALPFLTSVTDGTLVGNLNLVARFNGQSWAVKDVPLRPDAKQTLDQAYGEDLVVLSTEKSVAAYQYDPFQDQWLGIEGLSPSGTGPYTTTISHRFLTLEDRLYFLAPDGTLRALGALGPDVVQRAIANHAPSYIAYADRQNNTHVVFVENGSVFGTPVTIPERLFTDRAGKQGTVLSGPDSFVTFRADDFDKARELTLRKVLRGRTAGGVPHLRVARVAVDDGFAPRMTSYAYEGAGTTGPHGLTTQYSEVRVVEGSSDPTVRPHGSRLHRFHNGQRQPSDGAAFYSLLNGNPKSVSTYDAEDRCVAETEITWEVFRERQTEGGETELLYGAYVRTKSRTERILAEVLSLDDTTTGVTAGAPVEVIRQTHFIYNPQNGAVRSKHTENTNGNGEREEIAVEALYGFEIYPGMRAANLLTPSAATTTRVNGQVTSRSAIAWSDAWKGIDGRQVWAPWQTLHARRAGAELVAEALDDGRGPAPEDWLLVSEVVRRDTWGNVTASRNVDGLIESLFYDSDGWQPVAKATSGLLGGPNATAIYTGFELYEALDDWTLASGEGLETAVVDGDSHTGRRSVRLTRAEGELTTQLKPPRSPEDCLICGWIKTEPGFAAEEGEARWTVTIAPPERELRTIAVPIVDTEGQWRYFSAMIAAGELAGADGGRITVSASNAKAHAAALIDTVYFGPKLGGFSATVYDPVTRQTTATVAPDADVVHHLQDRDEAHLAAVGPGSVVSGLSARALWREGASLAAGGTPLNTNLAAAAGSGAVLERFSDGAGWKRRWRGASASWSTDRGALLHAPSLSEESVTREATEEPRSIYFKVLPREPTLNSPVGFRIGASCEIGWTPDAGWRFAVGAGSSEGQAVAPGLFGEQVAEEWLFLVTAESVHFFADGRLLFARELAAPPAGALSFFATDAVAFGDLLILRGASAEMAFSDGGEKLRQVQSLSEYGVIASARLYDDLHRQDVTTKPMFLPCRTLGYTPSIVTGMDHATGEMSGDLAEYYRGQDGRSDDEGYPYSRVVFEASPLGRQVKSGLPGKPFAIVQERVDGRMVDKNPHVVRHRYGTNDGKTPTALPRGKFSVIQQIDADGVSTLRVTDQRGAAVARVVAPVAGPGTRNVSIARFDFAGRLIEVLTPEQVATGTGREGGAPGNTARYDFLGRLIERQTVDGGIVKTIYDRAGRIRFAVSNPDALAKQADAVVYTKYDLLGRVLEGGIVETAWGDGETLRRIAERDPTWPSADSNVPHRWLKRFAYDRMAGERDDPYRCAYGLGQVWRLEAQAEDGTMVAYEQDHDVQGNIVKQTATTTGAVHHRSEIGCRYDGNGALIGLTYPDGFELSYRLNPLGQIVEVRDDARDEPIAEYTFDAAGHITRKRLRADASTVVTEMRYGSPGWLTEMRHATGDGALLLAESLRYLPTDEPAGRRSGSHTGRIAEVTEHFGPWSDRSDYSQIFETDGLGRLIRATRKSGASGAEHALTYDANGNIVRFEHEGRSDNYGYAAGTNRVVEVKDAGGAAPNVFEYDDQGRITAISARGLQQIGYDDATGMVTHLAKDDRTIRFVYDADNVRVAALATDGRGVSSHSVVGPDGRPLEEAVDGRTERFIYGAEGLLAVDFDETRSLFVTDYQGSTRAVMRNGAIIAGFNYQPFGSLFGDPFGDPAVVETILRRFTGKRFEPDLGLYDFGARYYDPDLGRFISADQAGQFFSPFLYAGNAPQNFVDPDGNFVLSTFLAIVAIAAAIGGAANAAFHARETKDAGDFFFYFGVGAAIGAATAVPGAGVAAGTAEAAAGVSAAFSAAYEASSKAMTGIVLGSAAVDAALTNGVNNLYEGNHFDDGLVTSVAMAIGTAAVFEAAAGAMSRLGRPKGRDGGDFPAARRKAGAFERQEPHLPKNAAGRTVLSGHGTLSDPGGAHIPVPEGTTITFYGPPNSTLMNEAANAVEQGSAIAQPGRLRMTVREGSRKFSRRIDPVTYRPGELVPNYVLKPIQRGWLSTSSTANYLTVSRKTQLSELLRPNMGDVDWAACTTFSGGGPTRASLAVDWK